MPRVRIGIERRATVLAGMVLTALFTMLLASGFAVPEARASFGIVPGTVRVVPAEKDGTLDLTGGSHPYQFTVSFALNQNAKGDSEGNVRDVAVDLPLGMVGNPLAVPRCSRQNFDEGLSAVCPGNTQVGVIDATIPTVGTIHAPVFNLVPPPGVPARLGVQEDGLKAIEDASVRTGEGYGVAVNSRNIPTEDIVRVSETVWGVPPDHAHDNERQCIETNAKGEKALFFGCASDAAPRPFLTLPTSCGEPLTTTLRADSTETPGVFPENAVTEAGVLRDLGGNPVGLSGCEKLPFEPVLTVSPATMGGALTTEAPAGLNVELKVPQPESTEGLAEANLKEALVKLPAGMTVSPSAANGLGACPLLKGREPGKEQREANSEEVGINLESSEPANCPDSSKLGTVRIETPLLEHSLQGAVFLAQQGNLPGNGSNPFGSLLALYVVAEGDGVVVKLPGEIKVQEGGQLTTRFGKDPITGEESLPQLPFDDLKMSFFGGPRAPLITPSSCGTYETTGLLTPYGNDPGVGPLSPTAESLSSFTVNQGCGPQSFTPSFIEGTFSNQAGAYSPLSVTFARQDGEQRFVGVQVTQPPGVLATIKNAVQCPEPQASQGECGVNSLIGETSVAAGPGEAPYWVKGGKVYLTGPYKNAPFGLSIVVPATAGPFNLGTNGNPVIVRARIDVNPTTAQAIVTSDPLPTQLQNVPLDVRTVNVLINRPNFIFNPTNCAPLATIATLTSTAGASSTKSIPFQAANCASLAFKPAFTASTQGTTSKANGASLTVKVAQKPGEANIHKVNVQLPLILPARLTTLQKACTEAQFAANPAGCPQASNIGTATAITPVLPVPLTGPAYLVSHGGAAFPDVEFVLQGDGVQIVLDGGTDIKKGITYSRFETVPDAPISSFVTTFPEGPHSALAANGNLCSTTKTVSVARHPPRPRPHQARRKESQTDRPAPLLMPTTITGQNGAQITQNTKIAVTGCPKAKPAKKAKKKTKGKKKKK